MNNLIKSSVFSAALLLALPSTASHTPVPIPVHETNEAAATRMTARLAEIKAMEKSGMTKAQRKALRDEVKEIKRVQSSGGVFLSVGAIIIIILLLILLV